MFISTNFLLMGILLRCNYKATCIWSSEFPSFQVSDTSYLFVLSCYYRFTKGFTTMYLFSHICKGLIRFKKTHITLSFLSLRQFNTLNFSKNMLILVLIQWISIIRTAEGPKSASVALQACVSNSAHAHLQNWCSSFHYSQMLHTHVCHETWTESRKRDKELVSFAKYSSRAISACSRKSESSGVLQGNEGTWLSISDYGSAPDHPVSGTQPTLAHGMVKMTRAALFWYINTLGENGGCAISTRHLKENTKHNFQSSVSDTFLFAVPITPSIAPRALCNLRTSSVWLVPTVLNRNELVGKLLARRDKEINGMALYVPVQQGNMPSSAQTTES